MTFDTADGEVDLDVLDTRFWLPGATGVEEENETDHGCDDAQGDEQALHGSSGLRLSNDDSLCPRYDPGNR
jgi:hypothetical protein